MQSAVDVYPYTLDELRTAWRDAAVALWEEGIRDTQPGYPGDREAIADLYREIGWGWAVEDGYSEEKGHEWCGVGQAAAGLRLGDHLADDRCLPISIHPDLARLVLPSTERLYSDQLPGMENYWETAGLPVAHRIDVADAGAGDLLTVYPGRARYGSHIAMAAGAPGGGKIATVEFNANGRLPDSSKGEGGVRKTRDVGQIALAYRFFDPHFVVLEE